MIELENMLAEERIDMLPPDDPSGRLYDFVADPLAGRAAFHPLGRMPYRRSCGIAASPLGVGFETLDRETFDPLPVIEVLASSGIKRARCQTGWIRCEKSPGVYDFGWLDEVVDRLAAIGIETWFSLSFGNPLYTANAGYAEAWRTHSDYRDIPGWARGYVGEVPLYHGEKALAAWLNYVRAIVLHFKGRVRTFEIWNEPEFFWLCRGEKMLDKLGTARAAADYVEFVRLTAEVVRAAAPDALIAGVTAGTGSVYIRDLGRAGLGKYIDIFCFHSYSALPESGLDRLLAHIRANIEVPGRPLVIWQGESGRSSGKSKLFAFPSQYSQAKFLTRRYTIDLMNGVAVSSFFTVTDFVNYYEDGSDQYYGVIDGRKLTPKLAFYAMQSCAWLCDGLTTDPGIIGWTSPPSLEFGSLRPYEGLVGAFRRRGVPVFAVWRPERVDIAGTVIDCNLSLVTDDPPELPEPVVIDPIRRRVWAVDPAAVTFGAEKFRMAQQIKSFPLADYPLFVTDRRIFAD